MRERKGSRFCSQMARRWRDPSHSESLRMSGSTPSLCVHDRFLARSRRRCLSSVAFPCACSLHRPSDRASTAAVADGRLQPLLARYEFAHLHALETAMNRSRSVGAAVAALRPRIVGESKRGALRRRGETAPQRQHGRRSRGRREAPRRGRLISGGGRRPRLCGSVPPSRRATRRPRRSWRPR